MADLSGSSSQWWALVLAAANEAYARWQVSTPLERLRLRVVFPLDIYRWPRTEQRAVTMLLAAVPDEIRREMIANRKLNSMDILFTLLCRFQPGGASERASLLRDISDPQLKQNANVQDFLTALRLWKRNLGRAVELGLQLPDPLILVNLLTRWADHLGRLGGAQLSYRVASLRQLLQLDTMPNSTSVVEFAEALQAEAEQLALSVQSTTSTSMTTLPSSSTASAEKPKKEPVKAAALQAEADSPKKGDTTTKAKCRFWGTPAGCKRADECKFEYSWDGIEKRGKCWACSSDQHMRNECPYKKKDAGSSPQKMAKVTGPKLKPTKSGKETKEGGDGGDAISSTSSTPGTLPTSSSTATSKDEKTKTPIIEELPVTSSTSTSLVNDITGLVKSLQSLKAVQLRYADACGGEKGGREEKVALIDGGATHPLRQGSELEIQEAEPVQVELAHGSTTLYRKRGCSTLLSREKIETIIPVRLLIDLGYKIIWNSGGCTIRHPTKGALRCWRRQGCPIMDEEEALSLLYEVEKEKQKGIADEIRHYWSLRFPNVPDDIFRFMKGQNRDAKLLGDELPWNRRQRRQFETAKNGILLHLFSGDADKRKKWEEVGQILGLQVMTLDILNNQNLHDEGVWCYVFHLAKLGKIKILVGGPPCRTTSRLRHQRPGPVPLRGRGHLRWRLPDLSAPNRDLVDGDTALTLKMLGIYDAAVEHSEGDVGFLMEHPEDPKMYLDANQHPVDDYSSVWEWPEIQAFAQLHKMSFVAFDQGATGHKRKKPTRLLTNLNGMEELNDLRSEGESAALPSGLGARLQESSSWASWSPGLVAAIQVTIKSFMNEGMVPNQKRITLHDWRQHCQQGHVPYRRDVLVTGPLADQAMLEFELETRPEVRHRLTGKQQVFPRLPPPQLMHSGSSLDGAEAPQEAAEPLALMDGFVVPPDDDIEDYDPESPVALEPNADGHGEDDRENEPDYVFVDDDDAIHRGEPPTVGGDPEHGSGGEDASLFRPQPLQAGQDLCSEQVQQGPQRGEVYPGGAKTLLHGTSPVASSTSFSPSTFQSCSMAEDGVFTWPWGGSVENYKDWLQSTHYGWNELMKEEMKETPMNGDEGLRKGQLLQNAQNEVMALQQELDVTNKILNKKFQMKHLAAAEETGDVVLQTYTVPLQDVRANLPEWIEALKGEYTSLTKTTGAVTPIRLEDLGDEEVEYAPAKLVATRKAPDGKRRTRIVACGNLVTSSVQSSGAADASETNFGNQKKSADTYAAGVEGSVMRATLRTCAARGFSGATTDVKIAFLLAPRRGKGKLVVRPPRILVEAGLISSDELRLVNQALYGLQASPADWSSFRDDAVKTWRWEHKGMALKLLPTMEPNLWRVLGDNKTTLGFMFVYVDDLMVLGPLDVVESVIDQIRRVWTCSTPEFFNTRPPRNSAALSSSTRSMMVMVLAPSWLVRRATPERFEIGMETQNRGLRR